MSKLRCIFASLLLSLCFGGTALAEGFAMSEWSARGLALAGGMVGRADDVSALAYNAAGITQLQGVHFMAGMSFVAPYGSIKVNTGTESHTTATKTNVWMPGHGYLSYQVNDNVWLGLGVYSRFGLGNTYDDNWIGRGNVYGISLTTFSAVPTVAFKINDIFSASLGVEIMHMSMFLGNRLEPNFFGAGNDLTSLQLEASSVGVGLHAGIHAKFNEQWSAGLTYKSKVVHSVKGQAYFGEQNPLGKFGSSATSNMIDTNVEGMIVLPDSIAFGISYKPLENLSFEVGTVYTRWSTFSDLDIYFDSGFGPSKNPKNWKDGWNFNASVEYSPLDWLTLRAGYWHETAVTDEQYTDYMIPSSGRDVLSLGVGFEYEDWTVDLAYTHMWVYDTNYNKSAAHGVNPGHSFNVGADLYTFSVGYKF